MRVKLVVFILVVAAVAMGFYFYKKNATKPIDRSEIAEGVNPSDIIDVLPRDAIPAIDNPKFESVGEANKWLKDDDLVFGLEAEGIARAYPQRILNWHEIVNDEIAGQKISVTFCPLCGSAVAYKSFIEVDGEKVKTSFGVSGKLYNSDLVMYDRETETLWSQITGKAISGNLVGQKLEMVSIQTLSWKDWKKLYSNSQVLSRETGYSRNYDVYPYADYETSRKVNFPVKTRDARLHEKAVIWGVVADGDAKAYPENKVKVQRTKLKDKIGNIEVELLYKDGKLGVKRLDTGEMLVPIRNFWFAWVAFYPNTELY